MRILSLGLILASAAYSQPYSRTFPLKNTSGQGLQEMATTLRSVFNIQQVSLDNSISTITVSGNPDQVALAEWLIPKLDIAPGATAGPQKYLYANNNTDVVELFPLKNAAQSSNLQEILTGLRTVADIQKIYMSSAPKILVLRADPSHIAMAEFLVSQLDQAATARANPSVQVLHVDDPKFDTLMVYGLAHTRTVSDLQYLLTDLRTVLQIQKIWQQSTAWMLALRADAATVQVVQWLLPKLDTAAPSDSNLQMPIPGGQDDVVKVFYLPQGTAPNPLVLNIRNTLDLRQIYINMNPPAIVVRSTADQVAAAGKLIAAR